MFEISKDQLAQLARLANEGKVDRGDSLLVQVAIAERLEHVALGLQAIGEINIDVSSLVDIHTALAGYVEEAGSELTIVTREVRTLETTLNSMASVMRGWNL